MNELGAVCRQLMSQAEQELLATRHIFAVYGCGRDETFDPALECLREEYEYLLPVSCLQPSGATIHKFSDGSSTEPVSMSADRWHLHGAGGLAEDAVGTLKWKLPQVAKGCSALISTKLDAAACRHVTEAGSSLEWCISRSAASDVRVRIAVRQAGQPDGEWWVSRDVSFPCALIEEQGQSEVKSQTLFGKTDTWQVLRLNQNPSSVASMPESGGSTFKRGPGRGSGHGRRGHQNGQQLKPQGKAVGLRAEWGGVVEIGWLVDGEADGAALVLKQLRVVATSSNSGESTQEMSILQRLTALLRCFDGSPRLHNYTEDASTSDRRNHARGVRCRNHGLIRLTAQEHDRIHEEDWIVISIAAPRLQVGQICRIVGVIASLLSQPAKSIGSEAELSFIEATLRPDCVVPSISTVCAPAALLYLTECKYKRWGGNRARRMGQDTAVARSIVRWRATLQTKLATDARRQSELWGPWRVARSRMLGLLANQAAQAAISQAVRCRQPLPEGWSVPEFAPVLNRLRHMTSAGTWPPTPASRSHIFLPREENIVQEAAGNNSLPPPRSITLSAATAGVLGLTELWHESVRLEAFLAPEGRSLPSGSVTINSHAQFRPHTDSNNGSNPSPRSCQVQTESDMAQLSVQHQHQHQHQHQQQQQQQQQQQPTLHVGIGSYTGGALFVEGVEYDIRYSPLSYDGVSQKHWTAPFQGERYTLVWA